MSIVFLIILMTGFISYKGMNDSVFFNRYKFEIFGIERKKEKIRFLSSGFLHSGWLHFAFNMITLYSFSPIVLHSFGILGFLVIYVGSLLLGNALSFYLYKNQPLYSAVGASGAVSGILFAAIAMNPHTTIGVFFIPMTGYLFGLLYFGYSVYMMLNPKQWDYIGHSAHLGGAVFGIVYALLFRYDFVLQNIYYIVLMSLPLFYLGFHILSKKK